MQEFIEKITSQLGIDESQARSATGGILNSLKSQLGEGDFSEVLSNLPGADQLAADAEEGESEGGGALGGLLGKASSMLGGGSGLADIAGVLGKSGLSVDNVGPLVSSLLGFLKGKLPAALLDKVKSVLPGG